MTYKDFIADPARDCAVVAHRGAWHDAPENSLAAIENAISLGSDIVELDVRKSADGQLFLMHDKTLARMVGIDRDAESFIMAELREMALRDRNGGPERPASNHHIPTLKEALEVIRGRIFADLDLKDRGNFFEAAACAKEMGAGAYIDLKTTVMTQEDVAWVRAQKIDGVPFMGMSRFTAEGIVETLGVLSELSPFMCEIRFDDIETIAGNRELFARSGMALWFNTLDQPKSGEWNDSAALVDPDAIWGRLINAGISAIQTDQTAALKSYIKARRK